MMELLCILAPSSVLQYVILNSDMIIRLFIVELGIYKNYLNGKLSVTVVKKNIISLTVIGIQETKFNMKDLFTSGF